MESIDDFFNIAMSLVNKAGQCIKNKVGEQQAAEIKSCDIDLVTETDQKVEKFLIHALSIKYPTHKFIGEESIAAGAKCVLTDEPTWVIDPIDGTMNFVHAFPHSCISLALFLDKEPVIGIIYNPSLEQVFTAKIGQGAFLNGKRIHASKETELSKSLIMLETGTSRDEEKMKVVLENQQRLIPIVHGTRSLGSAALNMAMVALGCAEANFEFGIHIWDIGAGEIIVKEAGGVVIDPSGGNIDRLSRRMLCAGTKKLALKLSRTLVQYYPMPRDD